MISSLTPSANPTNNPTESPTTSPSYRRSSNPTTATIPSSRPIRTPTSKPSHTFIPSIDPSLTYTVKINQNVIFDGVYGAILAMNEIEFFYGDDQVLFITFIINI